MLETGIPTASPSEERPPAAALYQSVLDALRSAVSSGALGQGSVVMEAVVADVMNTSRTPVKLALELLAQEGRLSKLDGRGYLVLGEGRTAPERRRRITRQEFAAITSSGAAERSPAAWTRIYDEVEREISGCSIYGRLSVVELELANYYSVSRTVARDVLTRVERVGLIEKDQRSRWHVVPLTRERIGHFYEVRRYLEPPALRSAASAIPQALLTEMWLRLTSALDRYPNVSESELDQLERDIHVDCTSFCGNPELIKLLRINQALLISNKHMLGSYLRLPELDPFLGEHKAILECLGRRDGDAAAAALDVHLQLSLPKVLKRLDILSASPPPPPPPYLLPE